MDYFALFDEERRPWLDPKALKQKYQELTLASHPDAASDSRDVDFAAINEAHRVLSDPKLRVAHLLQSEGVDTSGKQPVPNDIADLFPSVATLIGETDALLGKIDGATNALTKSMLRAEAARQESRLTATTTQLKGLHDQLLDQLHSLNKTWEADRPGALRTLRDLHQRLAYLSRWLEQLRERQYRLAAH